LLSLASASLPGLHTHRSPELVHLGQDHILHLGDLLDDFKLEVERLGTYRLVRRVVPNVQVSVLQSFFDRDTTRGVKREHAVQKVKGVGVGLAEYRAKLHLLHVREVTDVVLSTGRADAGQGLFVGCA
jgi:hypothetical protein